MKNTILKCKDVIKIYETAESKVKVPALKSIDLSISEGDLVSIIGPSGSGKTTFINVIGMLDYPSSGEIILDSPEFGRINYLTTKAKTLIKARRNIFGYMFQLPQQNLLYHLTAKDNVLFPMRLHGKLPREQQKKRTDELLKKLGILDRKSHKPSQLSGGEAQRLSLCIALANDPHIILADEPTGELDSMNTIAIGNYFKELSEDLGKTFIVVSHDHRLQSMVDVSYKINDGKISTFYTKAVHKQKLMSKKAIKRKEYAIVYEDGAMRIPAQYIKKYGILDVVKLEKDQDFLRIYPGNGEGTVLSSNSIKNTDFLYVSDDGIILLPDNYRKHFILGKTVILEPREDHFIVLRDE